MSPDTLSSLLSPAAGNVLSSSSDELPPPAEPVTIPDHASIRVPFTRPLAVLVTNAVNALRHDVTNLSAQFADQRHTLAQFTVNTDNEFAAVVQQLRTLQTSIDRVQRRMQVNHNAQLTNFHNLDERMQNFLVHRRYRRHSTPLLSESDSEPPASPSTDPGDEIMVNAVVILGEAPHHHQAHLGSAFGPPPQLSGAHLTGREGPPGGPSSSFAAAWGEL